MVGLAFTLLLVGVVFPHGLAAQGIEPDIAAASSDVFTISNYFRFTPADLSGFGDQTFILGGFAHTADVQEVDVAFRWVKSTEGWVPLWKLQVVARGCLPDKYQNYMKVQGEEQVIDLTVVTPNPQVDYRADCAFDLTRGLASFVLVRLDTGEKVYSSVFELEVLQEVAFPRWDDLPAGKVSLSSTYETAGLPFLLKKDLVYRVVREEATRYTILGREPIFVDDPVGLYVDWPQHPVAGNIDVELVHNGEIRQRDSLVWEERDFLPFELPIGSSQVVVAASFDGYREVLGVTPMMVYAGEVKVQIGRLEVPGQWTVPSQVSWRFAEGNQESITGQIRLLSDVELTGVDLQLQLRDAKGKVVRTVFERPVDLVAGEPAIFDFNLSGLEPGESLELVPVLGSSSINVMYRTTVWLETAPAYFSLPRPERGRVDLPFVEGVEHYLIYEGSAPDSRFNHVPRILYHGGVFYACWNTHPRDEDAPGMYPLAAISRDGKNWSSAFELFPALGPVGWGQSSGVWVTIQPVDYAESWVVVDDVVYSTATIYEWVDGGRNKLGVIARSVGPDGSLGPIFWLSGDSINQQKLSMTFPDARDPEVAPLVQKLQKNLLRMWSSKEYTAADGHRLTELTYYTRPDGVMTTLGRDLNWSYGLLYACHSYDGGVTWTPMLRTNIPDCPSMSNAGTLPDGGVYLIHNPVYLQRDPLIISLSKDGVNFDRAAVIRSNAPPSRYTGIGKGDGYQYPASVIAEGALWVIHSINKEDIAISRIPLESLQ